MRANIKLGSISGIEIGLHYSWFIIAALIVFSLGAHFRQVNPNWGTSQIWIAALFTAVLFFLSLLLHELSHSLVAQSRGLKVRAVTLFALGGVSQIQDDATDAKTEFWVAIAGSIASLVVGFGCLAIAVVARNLFPRWEVPIMPKEVLDSSSRNQKTGHYLFGLPRSMGTQNEVRRFAFDTQVGIICVST